MIPSSLSITVSIIYDINGCISALYYFLLYKNIYANTHTQQNNKQKKTVEYMYKYDTVHGRANQTVTHDKSSNTITIDGKPIQVFGEMDPSNIKWGSAGADYVVE